MTRPLIALAFLALASAFPVAAAAHQATVTGQTLATAQATPPPADAGESVVEDVIVTGKTRATVRDFIAGVSMADVPNRQIARFDAYVCPGVTGMRASYARAINDQIARVAYALRLSVGGPGCHPNILVVAAGNEAELNEALENLPPGLDRENDVSRYGPASVRRLRDPRPVRWWHQTEYVGSGVASRIREPGRVDVIAALVVLDMERVGSVNFEALSDYIAMVAFARIDPDATFTGQNTILSLFDDEASRRRETGLTRWDSDYLQGVYLAPRDGSRWEQEAFATWRMMRRDTSDEPQDVTD